MVLVLEERIAADYEPPQEVVSEYAKFLGLDLTHDRDLFAILIASLKQPLPPAWKPCQAEDGDVFYFNFTTGESVWPDPRDELCMDEIRRAKALRDAPVKVVTIHGACDQESGTATVRCCSSFSGEEVAVLELGLALKLSVLRSTLAEQLETSIQTLKIILPNGRLLTEDEDHSTLATTFDFLYEARCPEKRALKHFKRRAAAKNFSSEPSSPEKPLSPASAAEDAKRPLTHFRRRVPAPSVSDYLDVQVREAPLDCNPLKSVLPHEGSPDLMRRNPYSLRLHPIDFQIPLP